MNLIFFVFSISGVFGLFCNNKINLFKTTTSIGKPSITTTCKMALELKEVRVNLALVSNISSLMDEIHQVIPKERLLRWYISHVVDGFGIVEAIVDQPDL